MIYLDHNATTPLRPEVLEEMNRVMVEAWANPSAVHKAGEKARYELERARRKLAKLIGAPAPECVIFTGGGSESDNLAILGTARRWRREGRGKHLITSAAEHKAVLEPMKYLRDTEGFGLTILPVDRWGKVTPEILRPAMREDTILVSLMMANNELGTISPIRELAAVAHEGHALFHSDAIQAFGHIPVSFGELGVDLLTVSAHKMYGPRGIGALVRAPWLADIDPIVHGGGQEMGYRSGTENVAAAAGFAKAVELALQEIDSEAIRLRELKSFFRGELDGIFFSPITPEPDSLPGTISLELREGFQSRALARTLNETGFAVSAGSACTAGESDPTPSHVLKAIEAAHEPGSFSPDAIRIGMGRGTTKEEMDLLAKTLSELTRSLLVR